MKNQRSFRASSFLLTFAVLVLLTVLLSSFLPLSGEEELYDKVIRLHVLANSDSEEDQALKLRVRDAVLSRLDGELSACDTRESAEAVLAGKLEGVSAAAEEEIRARGYDYGVRVSLGQERYPEKEYDELTMPAGSYLSLKVEIGEAEGRNWWCVVFPPLCLSAARGGTENALAENEDALLRAGFTGEQYKIITRSDTPRYKLKFKLLELFGSWFE